MVSDVVDVEVLVEELVEALVELLEATVLSDPVRGDNTVSGWLVRTVGTGGGI